MDDDYYQFTIEHSRLTDDIRHADSAALVALKSRAYLNLIQENPFRFKNETSAHFQANAFAFF